MLLHERYVEQIVEQVVNRLKGDSQTTGNAAASSAYGAPGPAADSLKVRRPERAGDAPELFGVYDTVDEAIAQAKSASAELARVSINRRGEAISMMRQELLRNLELLARLARDETGMGRYSDKINKNRLVTEKTPGVEDLQTWAISGEHGLVLEEYAPYGVIGAIIPSTNPTETVINNGIGMFAAGNAVVFNPHPNARYCSQVAMSIMNTVAKAAGIPAPVFTSVAVPTIESASAVMHHPDIPFLAVTGSEAVVKAAMASGKKVVAAGPGNPPAVVDETADIPQAAHDIVMGGSLDNNIVCIAEKVTVAVASIADRLVEEMVVKQGCYHASANQIRQLETLLFAEEPRPRQDVAVNRKFVGKDAAVILQAIGVQNPGDPRLIICEVDPEHPFAWAEMLMPVMPVVRMPDADSAIDYAVAVERGNRHTAAMHSKNIDRLTKMGQLIGCSVYVKNGATYSGLGMGGEGHTSFTIASPTGDGLTTARTFSRHRRCALVGPYRIV